MSAGMLAVATDDFGTFAFFVLKGAKTIWLPELFERSFACLPARDQSHAVCGFSLATKITRQPNDPPTERPTDRPTDLGFCQSWHFQVNDLLSPVAITDHFSHFNHFSCFNHLRIFLFLLLPNDLSQGLQFLNLAKCRHCLASIFQRLVDLALPFGFISFRFCSSCHMTHAIFSVILNLKNGWLAGCFFFLWFVLF